MLTNLTGTDDGKGFRRSADTEDGLKENTQELWIISVYRAKVSLDFSLYRVKMAVDHNSGIK